MKQFDRLYKTIFESVKPRPSKNNLNRILKEDVNDANTPESITPEQRATIEKVVAKLVSEKEDFRDTVEFAQLDTDFFVMLLDGCYEDWCEEQGYDDEQPDMFDDKPGFEEFAYGSIKDFLIDYDADEQGTSDMIVSDLYDLKKELFYNEFVEVLKPQLDTFKAAVQKLIDKEGKWGRDSYFVDFALRDTKWWDENGLKYSPELGQKIDKLERMQEYLYDSGHIFAGDDYGDWDYPNGLLEKLGLSAWFYDEDETPELPMESKKVDTTKKVIKEQGEGKEQSEGFVATREQVEKEISEILSNYDWEISLNCDMGKLGKRISRKFIKEYDLNFENFEDFHDTAYEAVYDFVYRQ